MEYWIYEDKRKKERKKERKMEYWIYEDKKKKERKKDVVL